MMDVVKNVWWYGVCKIHGRTEHLTACGGCAKCADERIKKKKKKDK